MKLASHAIFIVLLFISSTGTLAEEGDCVVPVVKHLLSQLPVETVEDVLNLYISLGDALATCGHIEREEVRERERNLNETPDLVEDSTSGPHIEINLWENRYDSLSASISSSIMIPRFKGDVIVQFGNRTMTFCNDGLVPPGGIAVELTCAGSEFKGYSIEEVSAVGVIVDDSSYFGCSKVDEGQWTCHEQDS